MRRLLGAVLALAALAGPAPAQAQSPLAAGLTAHLWLLDQDGNTVASYNLAPGAWTESAAPSGAGTAVEHSEGESLLAIDPDGFGAVLVNQTPASLPALAGGAPRISLVGLGAAVADPATPFRPGVALSPGAGSFSGTLAVEITALRSPRLLGLGAPTLRYRVDGGSEEVAAESSHRVYLVTDGEHTIEARATLGFGLFGLGSPTVSATYEIAGGPIGRDSDGDGLPDVWEAARGMDPLADDFASDRDGDGWTDFEELIRGSDPVDGAEVPADTDGDGWSDFDEEIRGTDPADPPELVGAPGSASGYPSRPVARRLREVEYVLAGSVFADAAQTTVRSGLGQLTVTAPDWSLLYDQQQLPGAEALAPLGLAEEELAPHLRQSLAAAALAAGELPPVRTPGGDPNIVQVSHLGTEGLPDGWTAWAWLGSAPDLHPREVAAFLADQGSGFGTAEEWEEGYRAYLSAEAVQARTLMIGPASSAAVALVGSVVGWLAERPVEAEVLLGDPGSLARPPEAVAALETVLAARGAGLDDFHDELAVLAGADGPLAEFASGVAAIFAEFDPASAEPGESTTRSSAALVQGDPEDDDPQAIYLARLLVGVRLEQLEALSAQERAAWLDPAADLDGDGVRNADELRLPPPRASAVDRADTDGDLHGDGFDPCPTEPENRCVGRQAQGRDSDGDGVIDALDNCLDEPNADQRDSVGNGVGDACRRLANISTPTYHPTILAGTVLSFTSVAGGVLSLPPLSFEWDFAGARPPSTAASPGEVLFADPGTFEVSLVVTDSAGTRSRDVRTVVVVAGDPLAGSGPP